MSSGQTLRSSALTHHVAQLHTHPVCKGRLGCRFHTLGWTADNNNIYNIPLLSNDAEQATLPATWDALNSTYYSSSGRFAENAREMQGISDRIPVDNATILTVYDATNFNAHNYINYTYDKMNATEDRQVVLAETSIPDAKDRLFEGWDAVDEYLENHEKVKLEPQIPVYKADEKSYRDLFAEKIAGYDDLIATDIKPVIAAAISSSTETQGLVSQAVKPPSQRTSFRHTGRRGIFSDCSGFALGLWLC